MKCSNWANLFFFRLHRRDFIAAELQYDESQYYSTDSAASPRSSTGVSGGLTDRADGGGLTDRATSPSAASVTSLQSVSSQASVTGRR